MLNVLGIILGGGVGAISRYGLSRLIAQAHNDPFPWGTFVVNVVGAFLIGFLYQLFDRVFVSSEFKNFLTVGLVGAFSTFSIFTIEAVVLFREGELLTGATYFLGSAVAGLVAALLGLFIGDLVLRLMR